MYQYELGELLPIVAELTEKYTSKESTSVSYETAKQLMGAVIYCIEENSQMQINSVSTEVKLQEEEITPQMAYSTGYQLVMQKVKKSKELYEEIATVFCAYGNQNYYDTVIKGMPAFFQKYDVRFYPQNHILTLDYPLLLSLENVNGVDRIYQYLSCVQLEQLFLSRFPESYVREVLLAYHDDYENLYMNICNIVLRNVIGCMICEKQILQKGYSQGDYNKISQFVAEHKSRSILQKELQKKLSLLLERFSKERKLELLWYLGADLEDFSFELMNAVENNCLDSIFLL